MQNAKDLKIMRRVALAMGAIFLAGGAAQADDSRERTPSPTAFEHISCKGKPNEIRLTVRNVKKSVGVLTVELYKNDQETFLRTEGRALRVKFAARAPVTQVCLYAPEATDYAIGVYHDQNVNNKFDKRPPFGLPGEPYGVSNNPKMQFAPPTVDEALFRVPPDSTAVDVKLRGG